MKNVTKGTAKVLKIDISDYKLLCVSSDSKTDVICHMYLPNYQIEPNHEADAELFVDALNTYSSCSLSPSELKQQRDELLSMLKIGIEEIRNIKAEHRLLGDGERFIYQASKLIQKLSNENT